ncbi:dipeptidase [Saccharicrinis sp. FJH54]|uniref:dipeptidase n=1 Tax=Saccharicrinis sp. FJH54 TaxID=3344665 RepID=UPI0035D4A772
MKQFFITITLVILASLQPSNACTNLLVTKGASAENSSMISYAADSHTLYGELYHWPAKTYPKGTKLKVYEWDTGKYLGEIDQVQQTYAVVGNINEYAVSIGETTFGGRHELTDTTAIMDYGSLIYIALQRSKTAREAIEVMTSLVKEYGYYSSGESFSVADPNEVWILEMISKGPHEKGAVWVAKRIPDGYVCAHANQARITTIDFKDKKNCLYAPDVVKFAEKMKYFEGNKEDFDFSAAYAPLDYGAVRFCDARVWSFFNHVNPEQGKKDLPYILGESNKRMPLWIKPDKKISYRDVQNYMRDHFEGTPLDMSKDAGAGSFAVPYRWRPLTWEIDSTEYFNERAIATQQTGFSFVSQLRGDGFPTPMKGILWFGVDDAATSVYVPIYAGIKEIPECFKVGNGDMLTFTWDAAFWVFNWVSNWAYTRYSYMIEDIKPVQKELENYYQISVDAADEEAKHLYASDKAEFYDYITNFSANQSEMMMDKWTKLGQYLLVKYIDGNIKKEKDGKFIRTPYGLPEFPDQPGYSKTYYREVVKSAGENLKMREVPNE